jgi:hypothetical protein
MITLNDLIMAVPQIGSFESQIAVLRLPNNNFIEVNQIKYELRMFTFYVPGSKINFKDYVLMNKLENEEIVVNNYNIQQLIKPISYSIVSNNHVYLIISLLQI